MASEAMSKKNRSNSEGAPEISAPVTFEQVNLTPEYGYAIWEQAMAFMDPLNAQEALRCFEKISSISTPPFPQHYVLYNVGVLSYNIGATNKAIQALVRATTIDEDFAVGWSHLGLAQIASRRTGSENSFRQCLRCFEANSTFIDYQYEGLSYVVLKRQVEKNLNIATSLTGNPEDWDTEVIGKLETPPFVKVFKPEKRMTNSGTTKEEKKSARRRFSRKFSDVLKPKRRGSSTALSRQASELSGTESTENPASLSRQGSDLTFAPSSPSALETPPQNFGTYTAGPPLSPLGHDLRSPLSQLQLLPPKSLFSDRSATLSPLRTGFDTEEIGQRTPVILEDEEGEEPFFLPPPRSRTDRHPSQHGEGQYSAADDEDLQKPRQRGEFVAGLEENFARLPVEGGPNNQSYLPQRTYDPQRHTRTASDPSQAISRSSEEIHARTGSDVSQMSSGRGRFATHQDLLPERPRKPTPSNLPRFDPQHTRRQEQSPLPPISPDRLQIRPTAGTFRVPSDQQLDALRSGPPRAATGEGRHVMQRRQQRVERNRPTPDFAAGPPRATRNVSQDAMASRDVVEQGAAGGRGRGPGPGVQSELQTSGLEAPTRAGRSGSTGRARVGGNEPMQLSREGRGRAGGYGELEREVEGRPRDGGYGGMGSEVDSHSRLGPYNGPDVGFRTRGRQEDYGAMEEALERLNHQRDGRGRVGNNPSNAVSSTGNNSGAGRTGTGRSLVRERARAFDPNPLTQNEREGVARGGPSSQQNDPASGFPARPSRRDVPNLGVSRGRGSQPEEGKPF